MGATPTRVSSLNTRKNDRQASERSGNRKFSDSSPQTLVPVTHDSARLVETVTASVD
jgi:hypothetical protein